MGGVAMREQGSWLAKRRRAPRPRKQPRAAWIRGVVRAAAALGAAATFVGGVPHELSHFGVRDLRAEEAATVPAGKALAEVVKRYLDSPAGERRQMRKQFDATLQPLDERTTAALEKSMLALAGKHGPRLPLKGEHQFYDGKRGRFILRGKAGKTLFIGLHGGGLGSGDAGSAASAMAGGNWWWLFPEVLEKTEHGWTDSGTEEFVLDLIEAAKRTGKVDPNRIYITGHSMGGYGTWTLGAHHADVFAGAAAYAGAPTAYYRSESDRTVVGIQDGVLPNFYNLPLHVYQSLDDKNVTPESNIFANKALLALKQQFPGGFAWTYDEVDGRGHAAPADGYLPSLRALAERPRVPRPRSFLWQPCLPWKRQFYWLYWDAPEAGALVEARVGDQNDIEIVGHLGSGDFSGLSVLLGPPLIDLAKPVTLRVNGKVVFEGAASRTFSTLLLTLPRNDPDHLYAARIDLP